MRFQHSSVRRLQRTSRLRFPIIIQSSSFSISIQAENPMPRKLSYVAHFFFLFSSTKRSAIIASQVISLNWKMQTFIKRVWNKVHWMKFPYRPQFIRNNDFLSAAFPLYTIKGWCQRTGCSIHHKLYEYYFHHKVLHSTRRVIPTFSCQVTRPNVLRR